MTSLTLCLPRVMGAHAMRYIHSSHWRSMQTLQRPQQLQQQCRRLHIAAAAAATAATATSRHNCNATKSDANASAITAAGYAKTRQPPGQQSCIRRVPKRTRFCRYKQTRFITRNTLCGFFSPAVVTLQQHRAMSSPCSKPKLVAVEESRRFMIDCFLACNVSPENAKAQADLLVAADYRGHFSHGMNRLEMYINDLLKNSTDGCVVPKIIKQTPATAWVDGLNGLGAVVGNFCMDLAIEKAKNVGVGWVCAKQSNHYGMAGWYSLRAIEQGLVGISMTNTSPLMAPTRSKASALGTNPLAVGAPAANGDHFLLDMATTAVAVGKIEIQRRKGEALPDGWAQDPDGNVTNDAELGFNTACLMPLGGSEITSGYKGFGLGAMVDILSGVMAGANYSTLVRKWTHAGADSSADLGQVFIAVDPNCFAPDFETRMSDFNARMRNSEPTDPKKPVLLAGDKETHNMKAVDEAGGIQYLKNQLDTCTKLSEKLKVQPLCFL